MENLTTSALVTRNVGYVCVTLGITREYLSGKIDMELKEFEDFMNYGPFPQYNEAWRKKLRRICAALHINDEDFAGKDLEREKLWAPETIELLRQTWF